MAHQRETRICQAFGKEFVIEPEDFEFYERIGVPPPTWCPDCRNMRRLAWREELHLYKDICKLCGKSIVSIHAPGGPFTVYCRECWLSDKWDPMQYGRDYDFKRPFFLQYRELIEAVPRPALTGSNLVRSDYSHACESVKDCYYVFWSYFCENSQYAFGNLLSRSAYDTFVADNSDHAYETLHSNRLYRVRFASFSDDCMDSAFLYDCVGCSDCFGCVNLRKKKYCLWNEQLSKEEYRKRMEYWDTGSFSRLAEAKEKFRELYLSLPRRYAHIQHSRNATGDIIRGAKNCDTCFSALDGVENCKYVYFGGLNLKDSMDTTAGGDLAELLYETMFTVRSSRVFFSSGVGNSRDVRYSDWAEDCDDLFGCVGLKHKRFCILNKQYGQEEYRSLAGKIKKHMDEVPYVDKKGRAYGYGEFFPTELSAYAYNESFAFNWYPKTREEALAEGWQWREASERNYSVGVLPEKLPDHIRDAPDSLAGGIIGCAHGGKCGEMCSTAFKLTPDELAFYRDIGVALPRLCPKCRYAERMRWRNGFHVWSRRCMCEGGQSGTGNDGTKTGTPRIYRNSVAHFHGSSPCPNSFETTYAPGKPEIVYCEKCYQEEFL